MSVSAGVAPTASGLLGEAVAETVEHPPAADERDNGTHAHGPKVDPVRLATVEEDVLVALDEAGDRVQEVEWPERQLEHAAQVERRGHGGHRVEDRREEK